MNKILIGVLVGGLLGLLDGASALLHGVPMAAMGGIIIGSTLKGVIAGVVAGAVARRYQSLPIGIGVGLLVGALLATIVAVLQRANYVEIILPGSIVGAIAGFATQKYG